MKPFDKALISALNDYADQFGLEALLEKLFPGVTVGELFLEIYNAGLIPNDTIEEFV